MTCDSCFAAERNPRGDQFTSHCFSCKARALASTGGHVESQEIGAMTERYRSALEKLFGDRWKAGHEEVKRWAGIMDRLEATTQTKGSKP